MLNPQVQSDAKAVLQVGYENQGRTLVLRADLKRGWRERQFGYGFIGRKWTPYKADLRIHTQLYVFLLRHYPEFPDVSFKAGDELISYILSSGQFVMKVALTQNQPWEIIGSNNPGLFINKYLNLYNGDIISPMPEAISTADADRTQLLARIAELERQLKTVTACHLRAWIAFHEPNPAPPRDVREWCQRLFVPGGQFESNRRLH
jgi:hypothetical protein